MKRRQFISTTSKGTAALFALGNLSFIGNKQVDLIIINATPAGIMAAISASRAGLKRIMILERTGHIGGLPANGLGATDIATKGVTGGLFMEFVNNILAYYTTKYGPESHQVKDCSKGYHFEPSVAELVLQQMLNAEKANITVKMHQQLEACKMSADGKQILSVDIQDISKRRVDKNPKTTTYTAKQFIDASYEGDLMAMAAVPFTVGREPKSLYNEVGAGRVYKYWKGPEDPTSTFEGDDIIQAYNYRLCLTDQPDKQVRVPKPDTYKREDYISLIDDLHTGRFTGVEMMKVTPEMLEENKRKSLLGEEAKLPGLPSGLRRLLNPINLPNGKTDTNNQHWAFISSDLPEENWPYPTANWAWRDEFAKRLKDYTLGLVYFAQNDTEVPAWYRDQIKQWGLSKEEYVDNGNFPRQVYVREGRRMKGLYLFKAQDAIPVGAPTNMERRPPVHQLSITASHYALDSHACHKREPNKIHLDGFISYQTSPYTVPVGVMLPEKVENLVVAVAVSGTHIGFSTLRMEPCWMALGQAAGLIATHAIEEQKPVQVFNQPNALRKLQKALVKAKSVLLYYPDLTTDHPAYEAVQMLGLLGLFQEWEFQPNQPTNKAEVSGWISQLNKKLEVNVSATSMYETRAEAAIVIYNGLKL